MYSQNMDHPRNPNTKCIVCNESIYRRPFEITENKGHVFCSTTCYARFSTKEHPCLVCGTLIKASLNKKTCSRTCANIHRTGIKYTLSRPHDKVVDQRMIKLRLLKARGRACEICGYSKVEILHTHHMDRNRQNNDLSNLKLLCPNCHYEEHYLKKSWLNEDKLHSANRL